MTEFSKHEKANLLAQGAMVLLCAAGPCIGFFVGVSSKIEALETRQIEQFERLHGDLKTLEERLGRDEQMLYQRLDAIDERVRHVEQVVAGGSGPFASGE